MSENIMRDYVADAQQVIKNYPVEAILIKKYQYTTKKAVWFIKTNQKNYALKRYLIDEAQWQFMISAYNYLSQEANNVAPLINTKEDQPWVIHDNNYYILTNWVKGYIPDYTNNIDLEMLTRGIANLHLASNNFILPYQKNELKKLGNWPEEIRRKQGLLLEYKYEAESQSSEKPSKLYLNNFQAFFELCEEAAEIFESPLYKNWVSKVKQNPCLCVNSFSPHNFSLAEKNKLWLLHLDNICIDLPARDLRKLLFKIMYIKGNWCRETFSLIMKTYLELYPLSQNELKVLLAELKTPHLFINISSRYYLNKNPNWNKENSTQYLIKAIKLENDKLNILNRFWRLI